MFWIVGDLENGNSVNINLDHIEYITQGPEDGSCLHMTSGKTINLMTNLQKLREEMEEVITSFRHGAR